MKVKIDELRHIIEQILISTYYSETEASQIAEVLLYAEMSGKNTQGLVKLLGTEPIQNIKPKHPPKIIKDTKLSTLVDGGGNSGILVSHIATQTVIDKCNTHGFGIVGTNNTFSSTGVIGFYCEKIAHHDFIAIVMAGSPGGVAPHGSIDPLFGTNPIAFGYPTESEPLIFDMATSAITWYGLVRAKALGQQLPEGVAMDINGNPTTDPEKAMKGAIYSFDKNYKGSGLSMMVEIFTGPLVGAAYCDPTGAGDWGNLFIAVDPDVLIGKKEFKKHLSELIHKVKSGRKDTHIRSVHIPGEASREKRNKARVAGILEIDDALYQKLLNLSIKKILNPS